MSLLSKYHHGSTVAALSLLLAAPLQSQLSISSYTVDGGGGKSTGDSFVLEGTIGQPDSSSPLAGGSFTLTGGFWGLKSQVRDYATWAATNIAPGLDASFEGDANNDGIANGLVYVFGNNYTRLFGPGILTAPPTIVPDDVNLVLESSINLLSWNPILEYTGGVQTFVDPDVAIADGMVTHTGGGPTRFYRYRVELITANAEQ